MQKETFIAVMRLVEEDEREFADAVLSETVFRVVFQSLREDLSDHHEDVVVAERPFQRHSIHRVLAAPESSDSQTGRQKPLELVLLLLDQILRADQEGDLRLSAGELPYVLLFSDQSNLINAADEIIYNLFA